ncbi:hypothetical protein DMH04_47785 [Kibdelosporangium aridum]|uniref:S-adenosyl methyltransferase n=1 Tax=Kibdelosporangium aridum TaxID=2030 RepID=A0A428YJY0_KIBAR|nr:hypothetical protein DMH04_47785 [Kibdelosporangium aridum]
MVHADQSGSCPAGRCGHENTPSSAPIYDYLLGGGHNFEADRQIAERFNEALPGSRDIARLKRAFLRRAVVFMAEQGIRQFLDIGSSFPGTWVLSGTSPNAMRANRPPNVAGGESPVPIPPPANSPCTGGSTRTHWTPRQPPTAGARC